MNKDRLPTLGEIQTNTNEENSPINRNDIDLVDDIQKAHKAHNEDHSAVLYYDHSKDSWENVPTDSEKWKPNWQLGIKNTNKAAPDDSINEVNINENSKNELRDFLDDNGIYGYTEQIHAIVSGDTVPDGALDDIKEYLEENRVETSIELEEIIPKYNVAQLLDAYLGWNGIYGYTEDILELYGVDFDRSDDLFESKISH